MKVFVRYRAAALLAVGVIAGIVAPRPCGGQQLLPDIVPWVREDASYLVDWDVVGGQLRFQTMFANIGDGLFQIRTDQAGGGGATTPVTQRVFTGVDNGPTFQTYAVNSASNFHHAHGHIHFEKFSEFQLLEAVMEPSGIVTVGPLVANTVKTSYRIHDSARIPDPAYGAAVSYPSSNTGLIQNISAGFGDVYSHGTEGQSISLVGVPVGPQYWLRQIVDPTNVIREKSETNNSREILIDLSEPGKAILQLDGSFVQPGEMAPPVFGDLTGDRLIDVTDWIAFKAAAASDLTSVTHEAALQLGDLNFDRKHSIGDVLLFRKYFDAANGPGAFGAVEHIPEPSTLPLCVVAAAAISARRLRARALIMGLALVACTLIPSTVQARTTLFLEDFDGLSLGPNIDEALDNSNAWTQTPPAGWAMDDSGVPFNGSATRGVTEWKGWSFADKMWWAEAAGDQQRSQFALGQGTVAVADPDEWDDKGTPVSGTPFGGYYNAFMTTPAISLSMASPSAAVLSFSSSWRAECCDDGPARTNNQIATIRASYDGGANFSEILRWDSAAASSTYHADATNETVVLKLNNPAGAQNVVLKFGLTNAGNDWWWAIDNVEVFTPSVLEVNVDTGELTIASAVQMTGYEITSASGSLTSGDWETENLDAQNVGLGAPLSGDFNNDNAVSAADLGDWNSSFGITNGEDFLHWQQQLGQSLAPGESWETIISNDGQLLEFFLGGSSSFVSKSVGQGYDIVQDARDLTFTYTTADGLAMNGIVSYVTSGGATASTAAPEPRSSLLLAVCLLLVRAVIRR